MKSSMYVLISRKLDTNVKFLAHKTKRAVLLNLVVILSQIFKTSDNTKINSFIDNTQFPGVTTSYFLL